MDYVKRFNDSNTMSDSRKFLDTSEADFGLESGLKRKLYLI